MIMHEDKGVRGETERRFKDLPGVGDTLIEAAERNLVDCLEVVFGIEQDDAERFAGERAHFRSQELIDELG
jgi:hypothetical protein